jgi:hypothetical protein
MGEPQTADVQAPPAAPASPDADDDFERALAEYDEAPPAAPPNGNGNGAAEPPDPAQRSEALREQIDATRQLGELRVWALDVQQERLARREKEDTEAVFAKGREYVSGFDHLPADFVERWMRAEYSIDPELHHAWNSRYESADAERWARRCVRHALDRLRKAAEQVPDAEATSTRSAIAAAMLRTAGPRPPSGPPDYSRMSNNEFADQVEREHGFRPKVA